jgi:hypothetical protein
VRFFLTLLLCFSVLLLANAKVPDRSRTMPSVRLGKTLRGKGILSAGSDHLKKVASWHGMTLDRLQNIVSKDKALCMDPRGRLHYACPSLSPLMNARAAQASAGTTSSAASTASMAAAFSLHSLPGASLVIYLDFDGHTTRGTAWNTNVTGGADIVTPTFNTDGDASTYSASELAAIEHIWRQVAEDYAPFKVDVTTEDPGVEALRKTNAADANYGIRVCIGGSSYDWYGAGAAGVAYLDTFDESTDTPVFVFPAQLVNGNPDYMAEAVAHEVGHTFGLFHDGVSGGSTYYGGHGDWAPIMGVSYYKPITQWSRGEYTSASTTQDDVGEIAAYTTQRTDDHSSTISLATNLGSTASLTKAVIHSRSDRDLFKFTTLAGPVILRASPPAGRSNLNIELRLQDSTGTALATASPLADASAAIQMTLSAGTYYVRVDGVGEGNAADTGFSDYGSLGQYELQVQPVEHTAMSIAGINMSTLASATGRKTSALVRVINQSGRPVSDVEITGEWNGSTSVSKTTAINGQAIFSIETALGNEVPSTFSVTNMSHRTAAYESSMNKETTDTIQ